MSENIFREEKPEDSYLELNTPKDNYKYSLLKLFLNEFQVRGSIHVVFNQFKNKIEISNLNRNNKLIISDYYKAING